MERWSVFLKADDLSSEDFRWVTMHKEIEAKDDEEAKSKILEITKKFVRRFKRKRLDVYTQAIPCVGRPRVLDGERMVRLKLRFSNRRILRIVNPDVALVQGYGPKALDQIQGR